MEYQVSARKYRPSTFQEVVGQPHVVRTLTNAIASKRIAHAFLFSGTRGVGKTTMARLLAKALNCEQGPTAEPCGTCVNCQEIAQATSVDVIEIDGASNTSVDDVREIRENAKVLPFHGRYRIYIIDEVHMLSTSAFNALLKVLEEPPAHVIFIFATTELHKIPTTILSRCQHYAFRRIPYNEMVARLRFVAQQDGICVEDRCLSAIARASEGSMRDALSILDQAVAYAGKTIRDSDLAALLGTVPQEHLRAMIAAIIAQDAPAALRVIAQLLDQGHDLRVYGAELVGYARHMLVAAVVPSLHELRSLIDAPEEDIRQILVDARAFGVEELQELLRILSQAEDALRLTAHPRFVLEAAAIRATRLKAAPSVDAASSPAALIRPAATRLAGESLATPSAIQPPTAPSKPSVSPPGPAPADAAGPESRQTTPTSPASPIECLDWKQVVRDLLERHPRIGAFLENSTLVSLDSDRLTVGFPKTASVARSMMSKPDNQRVVAAYCAELVGRPVQLNIVELTNGDLASPPAPQTCAAPARLERDQLFDQARTHPLVQQARELFGSEVVAVRRLAPRQETR